MTKKEAKIIATEKAVDTLYNLPISFPQETPGLHKCKLTPKSVECKKRRTKNRNKKTHRK